MLIAKTNLDLSLILDAVDEEIAIVDPQGEIVAVNAAWCSFAERNGAAAEDGYLGWNYLDVCAASGPEAAEIGHALRAALEQGKPSQIEYPCHTANEQRWFDLTITPLRPDGRAHALLRHRDITATKSLTDVAEQARLQSELLIALVATSGDAIMSYDMNGDITSWNPAAERLYGYRAHEIIGKSMEVLYPEGFTKGILEYRDEIIAGKLSSFEATRVTKHGRHRLVWITAAPVRDPRGRIIAVSNIHRDITELRRHEESRQIVAQEVIHRAKNMLTIISAIHRRTAAMATSMEEFNAKFAERIASLSRSADFLTSETWSTVPLASLVHSQLALFTRDDAPLSVSGPEVELKPQAVKTIGMALHELGTNATKYGALGDGGGAVEIRWQILNGTPDDGPTLRFEWIETGQSFEDAPRHRGFGNTVLTRLAVQLLDARVDYRFDAAGLRWRIEIPAAHFLVRENSATSAKD